MDGQLVDTVVARGGAEAHLELTNLEEGSHTLSVVAEANGKSHEITSAFQVEAAIDTQIFGGPVHDHAFFLLKSSDWDHLSTNLTTTTGCTMRIPNWCWDPLPLAGTSCKSER